LPGPETCPRDRHYLVAKSELDRDPDDVFMGRVIGGKYPIVGFVGAGGMGTVYRAIQLPVGREVALKIMRSLGGDQHQIRRRFEQEAEVVAQLTHPNTVTLHDFGVHDDSTLYMVLELVRGHPLSADIDAGPIPYKRAAFIIAAALDSLVEAHGLGLVHRDLKPDNVMLVTTNWGAEAVKVLDFGIAKMMGGDQGATDQLTQTGMVFGTPRYMAPEQARGKGIGPHSDLYALGVLLFECLTGRCPFDADNSFDILIAHRQEPPPPLPPELGVPPELEMEVQRALAKEPEQRHPDARSMAAALRHGAGLTTGYSGSAATLDDISGAMPLAAPPPNWAPEASDEDVTAVDRDVSSTSREMAAEVVAYPTPRRGLPRVVITAAAAFGVLVAVVAGVLVMGKPRETVPVVVVSDPPEPEPPPPEPTPREKAEGLVDEGRALREKGELTAALERFEMAAEADPAYSSAPHEAAVIHALQGSVREATEALKRHLASGGDKERLATRLREEEHFQTLRKDADFSAWAVSEGLLEAPAVTTRTPGPRPSRIRRGGRPGRRTTGGRKPPRTGKPRPMDKKGIKLPDL